VQVTQTVPAGNGPGYTECDTADPDVTCRVISAAAGAVTLGITAGTGAVHGTRVVRLNNGAGTMHAAIADYGVPQQSGDLEVSVSPSPIYVGQWPGVTVTLGGFALTGTPCTDDNYCYVTVQVADASCSYPVEGLAYWFPPDPQGNSFLGWIDPVLGQENSYQLAVSWKYDGGWDPSESGSTVTGCGPFGVADPTPPPPPPPPAPAELLIHDTPNGVGDCYWPNGTQYTVNYTRVMNYQVVGPAPQYYVFYGSAVPTVQENVQTTSPGYQLTGGGIWQRSANPYTIDSSGVFVDFLAASGNTNSNGGPITANQSFTATGGTGDLLVNIGGQKFSVLSNVYSANSMTIAGTTSPRECKEGDSW
jgi:hypothetical protein